MRRIGVLLLAVGIAAVPSIAAAGKGTKGAAAPAKKAAAGKGSKAAAAPAAEPAADANAAGSFDAFCAEWMQKLAARERDNLAKIQWKESGGEKTGTYVGYSPEHRCQVGAQGKVPIGRIYYNEITYRRHGKTVEEARAGAPEPIEIFEVTEIFRYNHGKWDF